MLRRNQYLLSPLVPNRSDKTDATNGTSSNVNETGDASDTNLQHIVNHNFLMETGEQNNFAVINENDENYFEIFKTPMRFGTENHTEVIAQIGTTAHLPCTIHNIGEGVVSWIRKNDYHLLTVGLTTYSSDERFSATHLKNSEDWTLQIKYVQKRDAGQYECQVTKYPPMSIFLTLNVVEYTHSEKSMGKSVLNIARTSFPDSDSAHDSSNYHLKYYATRPELNFHSMNHN
ncbi:hypothetical protein PVAND_007092 [Polypedilum vanderplanki]|uniref:Ig-like domain-containing protein n=1 Tax=Polypedilum vanderplanki TaxID=319348 RepID=A0A9J6C565_POLVA|nr:hypothetical protein PVAND_007092 [Polypedilum vanderplanki]